MPSTRLRWTIFSVALAWHLNAQPFTVTLNKPPQRIAHVLVALADNRFQGIVPVPAVIGNGDDPVRNLFGARATD